MDLNEISLDFKWIQKWRNRGCETFEDVLKIKPDEAVALKAQTEWESFTMTYEYELSIPNELSSQSIFLNSFSLKRKHIYEICHAPSSGATKMALKIALDFIQGPRNTWNHN